MRPVHRYCGCGSPLARDNTASFCAACQARRASLRAPEVPADFWQTDVMADALASGDLGRMLRAYRSHPFHGHRPLPQTVVAGWLHVSQMTVSRIEQGKRRLTIDEINWFAGSLGIPVTLRWVPQQPSQAREDVDSISRRSLLGAGAGAALGLGATTAPAAARDLDPGLVKHWMRLMHLLRRHDATCGPREVLGTVLHELDLIAGYRRIAHGELRTQLLGVEARWSWFASWLGRDAGVTRTADDCADRALGLAREAEYADMVAYVLMRQSQWISDPQRALALAEAARDTRGTTDYIHALCMLRVAHGHALANDAVSCGRSLGAARDLLPPDHTTADSPETPWDGLGSREATPPYVLGSVHN